VVFENSSHMPQLEAPERFNALHLAFLEDPSSVTSSAGPQFDATASGAALTEKVQ